jgi:plasmid maintenance system antidote protein VapI
MEARGWTLEDIADRSGLSLADVRVVLESATMTTRLANGLAEAFGTSVELWINLAT